MKKKRKLLLLQYNFLFLNLLFYSEKSLEKRHVIDTKNMRITGISNNVSYYFYNELNKVSQTKVCIPYRFLLKWH